jgi:hypothetical protein
LNDLRLTAIELTVDPSAGPSTTVIVATQIGPGAPSS